MQTMDYREAWALGTYRRFDSLVAPAFYPPQPGAVLQPAHTTRSAQLYRLSTDLPSRLLSWADYLAGQSAQWDADFSCQLALFLRYLAAPQTFEPLNSYKIHTPVPSVRCLFPYKLLVIVREAQPVLYEYHPNYHALEKIAAGEQLTVLLGTGDFALLGVSLFWKLADKYGDFTPYPVTLEMGGLKAQAEHLCTLMGWSPAPAEAEPDVCNQQVGCLGQWETVAFSIAAHTGCERSAIAQLPRENHQLPIWQAHADLASRFRQLRPLSEIFQAPAATSAAPRTLPTPVINDSDSAIPSLDILQLFRRRNSGNDAFGFAPCAGAVSTNFLAQLQQRLRQVRARRPHSAGEESVSLWFLWLDGTSGQVGLYREDGTRVDLPHQGAELVRAMQAALPNQILKFNMAAMTLSVLMTVNLPQAHQQHGDAVLRRVHTAAGMLGQDLNLTATGFGLFSRPVRMFRESTIEHVLQVPGQLVYQVLMGFNRRTNVKLELL